MLSQKLEELKARPIWVNYFYLWNETKNAGRGGYDKPPVNPKTLRNARTDNPTTWADYETAAGNVGKEGSHKDSKHPDENGNAPIIRAKVEGVGLVLTGGLCGVDFDHVIDSAGNVAPWAAELVKRLDTYTEKSPSGTGLHCLLSCVDLLEAGETFSGQFIMDDAGQVITEEARKVYELEIYAPKEGGRYFTVTGNVYHDAPIRRDGSGVLREIFKEYSAKKAQARAAKSPAPSVGTHYTGRAGTEEDNKRMLLSALKRIDPAALDFGEWAAIMTAGKYSGLTLDDMEEWSSGRLSGTVNPKNDPATNARRWDKFHFDGGRESAGGVIINKAKEAGWTPAEAFTEEERTDYARSLYTDEQRRQYGREQHAKRADEWADAHADDMRAYLARHQEPTEDAATGPEERSGCDDLTPEDIEAMKAADKARREEEREEGAKESEILHSAFMAWHNGEDITEQLEILENEFYIYVDDDPVEFFRTWGLVDADGNLTEWGREELEKGEPAPQSVGTQPPEAEPIRADDTEPEEDASSVGTSDDRANPGEPAAVSLEEWERAEYYAVTIESAREFPPGENAKLDKYISIGHADYIETRDAIHGAEWFIIRETFETAAEYFPGYATAESLERELAAADDSYLEIKHFPELSRALKLRAHTSVVLAADTGAGKSSLTLNLINNLIDRHPVIYVNLEMDNLTVLRRLAAIRSGLPIEQIEGYNRDEKTRAAVNDALRALTSGKPLQILDGVYQVEQLEPIIKKSIAGRKEPTLLFIDHGLRLTTTQRTTGRYDRFTEISEKLRGLALSNNIIMFTVLQQNRAGKANPLERPTTGSLKESGSWENDAEKVLFLWYDPEIKRKKIIIAKNRGGATGGEITLDYWPKTQTYKEAPQPDKNGFIKLGHSKKSAFDNLDIYEQARGGRDLGAMYEDWQGDD